MLIEYLYALASILSHWYWKSCRQIRRCGSREDFGHSPLATLYLFTYYYIISIHREWLNKKEIILTHVHVNFFFSSTSRIWFFIFKSDKKLNYWSIKFMISSLILTLCVPGISEYGTNDFAKIFFVFFLSEKIVVSLLHS